MLLALWLIAAPTWADAKVWRNVMPLASSRPITVKSDGVSVRFEPIMQTIRAHTADGERDEIPAARITVFFPGYPALVVPDDEARIAAHGIHLGIGRLNRSDALPVVILEGYSGGMHCCATLQMIAPVHDTPAHDALAVLQLPGLDGSPGTRFPKDLDGDGTADIIRADDSFLYAFASYNASWSVPQVYNLRDGDLVDVSGDPRYSRFHGDFARRMLAICTSADKPGRNGACAAYAAAMARLGQGDAGIAIAARHAEDSGWLPDDCLVDPVDDVCPAGQERQFTGFEDALRWFLQKHGYIA